MGRALPFLSSLTSSLFLSYRYMVLIVTVDVGYGHGTEGRNDYEDDQGETEDSWLRWVGRVVRERKEMRARSGLGLG